MHNACVPPRMLTCSTGLRPAESSSKRAATRLLCDTVDATSRSDGKAKEVDEETTPGSDSSPGPFPWSLGKSRGAGISKISALQPPHNRMWTTLLSAPHPIVDHCRLQRGGCLVSVLTNVSIRVCSHSDLDDCRSRCERIMGPGSKSLLTIQTMGTTCSCSSCRICRWQLHKSPWRLCSAGSRYVYRSPYALPPPTFAMRTVSATVCSHCPLRPSLFGWGR